MKTFLEYLGETQKTYEFKVKIANLDPKDHIESLKVTLAAYAVESISTPKRLPIMENNIDFPSMKNCEIHVFEVALKYPVMTNQLRELISERLSINLSQVFVTPSANPEELWRNNEGELREYVQGEDVLTKPLPEASAEQQAASKFYSEAGTILKELNKPVKFEIAGTDTTVGGDKDPAYGKTSNDIAQGKETPLGKQNTIPNPGKSLR
jgi:hypothetical protein